VVVLSVCASSNAVVGHSNMAAVRKVSLAFCLLAICNGALGTGLYLYIWHEHVS
jgi:hypothetical protein